MDGGSVSSEQVVRAAKALKEYASTKDNALLIDNDAGVYLGYRRTQVPIKAVQRPKCFQVPHSVYPPAAKVCLFVKDIKEGDKHTKEFYNQLKFNIDKVMVYDKVKKQYHGYDSLRVLAAKYDVFLVDKRLTLAAYHVLGRQFAKKAHKPIPINIEGKTTKEVVDEINRIKTSAVYLPANGTTSSIKIGTIGFTAEQIRDNVTEAVKTIQSKEDWSHVVNMYIKTPTSPSLTIYQVLPTIDASTPSFSALQRTSQEEKQTKRRTPGAQQQQKTKKHIVAKGASANGQHADAEDSEMKDVSAPKKAQKKRERKATPNKAEATPTKGEAAPTKGEATPTEEEATPTKGEATPTEEEATPTKGEATPTKGEATPTKGEATPKNTEATPKKTEATPKKAEATPKNAEAATKKGDITPKKTETTPKKADPTPKKGDATPRKSDATPKKNETKPKNTEATPKQADNNNENGKKRKADETEESTTPKSNTKKVFTPKSNKKIKS